VPHEPNTLQLWVRGGSPVVSLLLLSVDGPGPHDRLPCSPGAWSEAVEKLARSKTSELMETILVHYLSTSHQSPRSSQVDSMILILQIGDRPLIAQRDCKKHRVPLDTVVVS
jgi:hypothetical protein